MLVGNTSVPFCMRPNITPMLQNTWMPRDDPRPASTGPSATPQRTASTAGVWPSPAREEARAEVADPLLLGSPDAPCQRLLGPSGPYGSEVRCGNIATYKPIWAKP